MKKLMAAIAVAACLAPPPATAAVGTTYLTAYDKAKGSQASAGKYGRQIKLNTTASAAPAKGSKSRRAGRYTQKVSLCGSAYFTTKRGVTWINAHRKAGHELVVRKHIGKRKYTVLCGKIPKRVRSARKASARTKTQ